MSKLWVLVSNSARARIFECERPVDALEQVAEFSHAGSRQHPRDLVADKSGRVHDSHGEGRHSMEPDHTVRENEADSFAREIDKFLCAAQRQGRYENLAVVAAPRFLGRLRDRYMTWLPAATLFAEVSKDLTAQSPEKIRAELEPPLPPARNRSPRENAL